MNIVYASLARAACDELRFLQSAAARLNSEGGSASVWLPCARVQELQDEAFLHGGCVIAGGAEPSVQSAEAVLAWLAELWAEQRPDLLLFCDSAQEIAARLAGRLDLACFAGVFNLSRKNSLLVGQKKVCGSNLDWEFSVKPPAVVILAANAARQGASPADVRGAVMQSRPVQVAPSAWLISHTMLEARRANPLEDAPLVFACGRGMGSRAACERLCGIAARYGAPLGFSRPASLNGWGAIDSIIGQSGIKLRAGLCVAVGVSWAAAFMAGVDSAARLIAVNPCKDAPIFKYADEGIIASADEFMAEMEKCAPPKMEQ